MELQITIDPAIVPVKSMEAVPRPPNDSYRRRTNERLVEFEDGALSSSAYKIDAALHIACFEHAGVWTNRFTSTHLTVSSTTQLGDTVMSACSVIPAFLSWRVGSLYDELRHSAYLLG